MSDDWFAWHLCPDGDPTDAVHPQEVAALKDYIRSTTITPDAAAHAITQPVINEPETLVPGQDSSNLYRLWGFLIAALTDLPEQRARLVELLQALQRLPTTTYWRQGDGREGTIHWADLDSFGHLLSDLQVSADFRGKVGNWDPEQREAVRQDYIREATINAQLVVANVGGIPVEWGLQVVCDALERSDAVLDFEVPAARVWLEIAGQRIFQASDGEVGDRGYTRQRDLWKQEAKEGGKQRWGFWKRRLQSIVDSEKPIKETSEAATKAIEAMEAVVE